MQFVCGKKETVTPAQDKLIGAGGKGGRRSRQREKKKDWLE